MVEYPDSLDDWIGLAPNKDRVSPPVISLTSSRQR